MRVAWVTPLGVESAIAEYSVHITRALSAACDIEIWASDDRPWRDAAVPVSSLNGLAAIDAMSSYEARVYHMGDHARFHRAVYDASRKHPGYCVLHDRAYQSFFGSMWLSTRVGAARYQAAMFEHYGSDGHRAAVDSVRGVRPPVWEFDDDWLRYPLDEELIGEARGVLVHSEDHRRAIASRWFGPVGRVHFPSYELLPEMLVRTGSREIVTLVITGYMNRNKQIRRVISAIARDDELRRRVRLIVAGPGSPGQFRDLERLVRDLDLRRTVQLRTGFRPPEELRQLCVDADVFVNLREPSFESASASLMEQLAYGKPVVTSDNGFRTELPDGSVIRIPVGDDVALVQVLKQVVTSPELRAKVGNAARRYAQEQTVERAADDYARFFEEAPSWGPILDLSDRVGVELRDMGVTTASPSVRRIGREIAALGQMSISR